MSETHEQRLAAIIVDAMREQVTTTHAVGVLDGSVCFIEGDFDMDRVAKVVLEKFASLSKENEK